MIQMKSSELRHRLIQTLYRSEVCNEVPNHPTITGVSELRINFKQDQSWIFIKKLQQFRISYKLQSDPNLELINNAQKIS